MDLEFIKELYAERMNVKNFDAWVNELQHWHKNQEISNWYEGFATFCYDFTRLNIENKRFTTYEATEMLLEVNSSNKYARLKTLYQYVKGNWITQQQFCELMEEVFGLKI